jgi:hypothetical protein
MPSATTRRPSACAICTTAPTIAALETTLNESLTIRNLAIVFDEGVDNPIPQPPGCPIGPSTPGFVYLDNITVELNGVPHVWTDASDNGNGQTIVMSTDPLETLLDAPLETLFPS